MDINHTLLNTIPQGSIAGADYITLAFVVAALLAFIIVLMMNRIIVRRVKKATEQITDISRIMQQTLEISKQHVVRYDILHDNITNLQGDTVPAEGTTFERSLENIHREDRQRFTEAIDRLRQHVTTSDECTFRWNVSNNRRQPEWRNIRSLSIVEHTLPNGQVASIICTLSDDTQKIRQQQQQQQLTDKYRMIFERSIVGLAFYDRYGMLLAVNKNMRDILHFQGERDPYFFGSNLFNMSPFHEVVTNRQIKSDLYLSTRQVIPERGVNTYIELRLHPITDNSGKITYYSLAIRDVSEERIQAQQTKADEANLRRANEDIQRYEIELKYLLDKSRTRVWHTTFKERKVSFYKELSKVDITITYEQFVAAITDDAEGRVAKLFQTPEASFAKPINTIHRFRRLFFDDDVERWYQINSAPYYDDKGQLIGSFGIIRNITPLMEAQQKLKQETERANDSGRLKSVFMANMTHEIRTPLNAIVGFSDVLQIIDDQEQKKELLRIIRNNCDMLLRLINDILAISSMNEGGLTITPVETEFATMFNDICQSLAQRVQEPAVAFINDNPYSSFRTTLDGGRIQQVITNFVTNAVKYTHQGHIKVGYRRQQGTADGQTTDGLYIYCEDTGAGIPKEKQASVFERFVKLNDYIQGTGLGLSICKAIATRCKGSVGVESDGDGCGSTFWFWMPCHIDCTEKGETTT